MLVSPDITEVVRLALSGVHVNLIASRGGELSHMLDEVVHRLEERGCDTVVLRTSPELSTATFATLRLSYPELFSDVRDHAAIIDRFCDFVRDVPEPFLVVDNIDQADAYTIRAIAECIRRTSACLISSLSTATARMPEAITAQPHSQVVARNLSHLELESWLRSLTPHPPELELVTRIYVDTRGMAAYARSLYLSAIRENQIVLRDGWWTLGASELWTAETAFTVQTSLSRLSSPAMDCLRAIHLEDAPTVDSVLRRFSTATVTDLEREGLISVVRSPDAEPRVMVTPPVVARALEDQLGRVLRTVRDPSLDLPIDEESVLSLELTRAMTRRAATARAAFEADPTSVNAIELVHTLWSRSAPADEIERVFAAVSPGEAADDFDLLVLRARWTAFGTGRYREAGELLASAGQLTGEYADYVEAHRLIIEVHGQGFDDSVHRRLSALGEFTRDSPAARFARLTVASVHLLAGHATTALELLGDHAPAERELRPLWTFTRGYALLSADEPARAIAMASQELRSAHDSLDSDGVFTASYVLVAAHMFLGNWGQSQSLARAVRSIGRPNLHTIPVYRTTVGVQAIVFAEEGDAETAEGLMRLVERSGGAGPLTFAQRGMPAVARMLAVRDYDRLAELLAAAGEGTTLVGSDYPSSFLWGFALGLEPRFIDRVPPLRPDSQLPAYTRVLEFFRLLATDDIERIDDLAAAYPQSSYAYVVGLGLIRTAQRLQNERPARAERYRATADALFARLSIIPPHKVLEGRVAVLGLSARELQVALLAGRISNREIAGRLDISERTVDHHVSNALQKSGARDRRELSRLAASIRAEW